MANLAVNINDIYQAQLEQLEHDLTGRTSFPVQVELAFKCRAASLWITYHVLAFALT